RRADSSPPVNRAEAKDCRSAAARNPSSQCHNEGMPANRWLDRTQPQTLYIAVILLYINAVFGLIFGLSAIGLLIVAGQVGAGYGIANEKKWGYGLGLLMAFLPFILGLIFLHNPFSG